MRCPQQQNGSDCGVYMILFVTKLFDLLSNDKLDEFYSGSAEAVEIALTNAVATIKPSDANEFRVDTYNDIVALSKA